MELDSFFAGFSAYPDRTAVTGHAGCVSYAEFSALCEKQRAFLQRHGIDSAVVAVRADFSPASLALFFALISQHCVLVPVMAATASEDYYLQNAFCEHLIVPDPPEVAAPFRAGNHDGGASMQCALPIRQKADFPVPECQRLAPGPRPALLEGLFEAGRPGLVLFSSGSTGKPKAALHDMTRLLPSALKPGKPSVSLALLLFDHIGGINTALRCLSAGGTLVTMPRRDAHTVAAYIERYGVELLPASPTFLNLMLLSGVFENYDMRSLRLVTYGTESMPPHLLEALVSRLPQCRFKQTYGLSELGILPSKSEEGASLWMKLGGQGFETAVSERGTLKIRAASSMLGYLNAPSPLDAEGWLDTGDRVEQRGDFFRLLGREDSRINIGGKKVYPAEIEDALLRCPGVLDARVSAVSNALTGQTALAEVMVAPENKTRVFKAKLLAFCAERLDRHKIPGKIRLTTDSFAGERLKKKRAAEQE